MARGLSWQDGSPDRSTGYRLIASRVGLAVGPLAGVARCARRRRSKKAGVREATWLPSVASSDPEEATMTRATLFQTFSKVPHAR